MQRIGILSLSPLFVALLCVAIVKSNKFSFVPLIIWVYSWEPNQANQPLKDKLSSIGADITYNFHQKCTHVLVDELTPLREELLDAIVAKKACVQISWVERVAEEKICNEIPSCSNHTPTLSAEGVSVKLADQGTRENCMEGYTFVLDSINSYKYRNQLQSLLELTGAKILSIEGFSSSSQESKHEENSYVVCVIPGGSPYKFDCFNKLKVSSVKEIDLMCVVLTGTLDQSILISPCADQMLPKVNGLGFLVGRE
ncbi:nibrin homolog [Humulus lupulus]|uniref:nibrin homolog n=1 Tax=Humulus lupulus TaxID=3486 RepID=UPI002B4047F2|nr:nibrin homolog [Humulus lupulus]